MFAKLARTLLYILVCVCGVRKKDFFELRQMSLVKRPVVLAGFFYFQDGMYEREGRSRERSLHNKFFVYSLKLNLIN